MTRQWKNRISAGMRESWRRRRTRRIAHTIDRLIAELNAVNEHVERKLVALGIR